MTTTKTITAYKGSITKDVLSAISIAVFVLGTMALITGVFA